MRLLIQAGAEVNRSDKFGNSQSYYATMRDDKETIELLLRWGNIEHRRSDGETLKTARFGTPIMQFES